MSFHGARERDQGVTAHHAVGIEHDHAFVVRAPAAHEVGDVARLALAAVDAAAVEDALGAVTRDQAPPHLLLIGCDALIARVGEDEKIERALLTLARERGPDRGEAGADAHRIFVVYRHHHGGARAQGAPRQLLHIDAEGIAAGEPHGEAGDGGPQCAGNPGEERKEQHHAHHFDAAYTVRLQHIEQQRGCRRGGQEGETEEQRAPNAHLPAVAAFAQGVHWYTQVSVRTSP